MAAVNHAANVLSQAQGVKLMAAVNHPANVLSQAQGVKPDSNVEYSLNPSVLYSPLVRSPTVKDFP